MSKVVKVKDVLIGGGNPISVQSMTNLPVTDVEGTLQQISQLKKVGCDIVRVAIPNASSVKAFSLVRNCTDVALVADIHFDYCLAVGAIENGADKIRINPGNIASTQLDCVIDCAKKHAVPIRIGVNGGSINKDSLQQAQGNKALAMYNSLQDYVKYFERRGFDNLVLSVKSSDVRQTIEVNKLVAKLGYPLHLGVTEAGLPQQGVVKNAVGIGCLLMDGIGDTIRVSLTGDPCQEVVAGIDILRALNLRNGVTFVSCPKCGRCSVDLEQMATDVYNYVKFLPNNIKVAVMGCEVNGPGECKDADLGIAGAKGNFVFFKKGQIFKTVKQKDAFTQFTKEIDLLTNAN